MRSQHSELAALVERAPRAHLEALVRALTTRPYEQRFAAQRLRDLSQPSSEGGVRR